VLTVAVVAAATPDLPGTVVGASTKKQVLESTSI